MCAVFFALIAASIVGTRLSRVSRSPGLAAPSVDSPSVEGLAGASFGQALVRIRVHRLDGRPLSLLRALQRQLLVCLVIPPLVFREDGRGLHDLWTGSGAFEIR